MADQKLNPIDIEHLGRFAIGEEDHSLYYNNEKVQMQYAVSLTRKQVHWAVAAALAAILAALASGVNAFSSLWSAFWKKADSSNTPVAGAVMPFNPVMLGCVGPFVTGRSDVLHTTASHGQLDDLQCATVESIKQIIGSKKTPPTVLAFVGSADKFVLSPRTRRIYGSNNGLAQARADWVIGQLGLSNSSADPGKTVVLSFVRGPTIHGVDVNVGSSAPDRSVAVYGLWAQEPPLHPTGD